MKDRPASIKKAYLYISRNESSLKEKIGYIKKYIPGTVDAGADLKVFDTGDSASLEGFDSFVSSPSLFSELKVALLENIEKAPAAFQKKAAERLSKSTDTHTVFIFTSSSERINRTLLEEIKNRGTVKKIKPHSAGDLHRWLEEKSAADGITFNRDASALLIENVNLNMDLLKNEYRKLYDYISSEKEKTIDRDTVRHLVSRVYSLKIFDLVDFLGERDKERSLEALGDILVDDRNMLGLITLIHRMFKSMLYIKNEKGKGSVTDYLARNINMPPYFIGKMVNKYIKFSRNYSEAEIIKIIELLNDFDIDMRKSIISSSKLVKTMIARITDIKTYQV